MWAILGTSGTAERIVKRCTDLGVDASPYGVVGYSIGTHLDTELVDIHSLDCEVFTSVKAVELVAHHLTPAASSALAKANAYAIGSHTAEAVHRMLGATSVETPRTQSSEGLIELLDGRRFSACALFSSVKRSQRLRDHLRSHSDIFYEPTLYDLVLQEEEVKRFRSDASSKSFRGVVFTCSTASRSLAGVVLEPGTMLVAMGSRTEQALPDWPSKHVPREPSVKAVSELIAKLDQEPRLGREVGADE